MTSLAIPPNSFRAFVAIESEERPDSYECVSVTLPDDRYLRFASGDFLADWRQAMIALAVLGEEAGYAHVVLAFSSSVDRWEENSCQFTRLKHHPSGLVMWRQLTKREQARARKAYVARETRWPACPS